MVIVGIENGPASGQRFQLKRCPLFLRVVQNKESEWDALDLIEDVPSAEEKVYCYRKRPEVLRAMVDGKNYSGPIMIAEYDEVTEAPTDAEMRSTYGWQRWCRDQI
jgi:hypothetical protein